jgi:serine/threonine protein kinase
MPALSSCPTASSLQRLLTGEPVADQHTELLDHLATCPVCRERLDKLAGADPVLLNAATASRLNVYAEEAPLRRVLDALGKDDSLATLHYPHGQIEWWQSLLRPVGPLETPGQLDDYEVTRVLGQGGMGLVFQAFDPALRRWVAIKVLAPNLASDPVARRRFEREAQAAAAVRHEHVITIHAVREAHGLPYLVMEYLAGGSLQDHLDRHGPPDWRVAARLGAQIASGLAAAHAHGLIHRDIKPSNILLSGVSGPLSVEGASSAVATVNGPLTTYNGLTAKISDFGLARAMEESRLTQTGIVAGTPMYMSPEQAQSEPLDHRADLFSLGSVLYTLCTGREPFPGGSPMVVLRQVCEMTPTPIGEINPATPPWLAAVVERLHAKDRADRFASAAEVAELLRYNLEHPDQPRSVPRPRTRGWLRRKKHRLLALAVALGLLLTVGLMLSGPPHGNEPHQVPVRATLQVDRQIWSVAFSPDGTTIATGSDDTTLRLWDAATGQEKAKPFGHGGAVYAVAFAHSGKFLVTSSGDGTIRIWDVATGQEQPALPRRNGTVRRVAISPDDQIVAMGSSTQDVELWDLNTRELRHALPGHQGTIFALAFAPDGKTLATGDASGQIRFWDPVAGDERVSFTGYSLGIRALAFSPDSQTLASAGTGDKDVKLWKVATHEPLATLAGRENGFQNVAFSPDGTLLAAGCRDGFVLIWDVHSAQTLASLQAHKGPVFALAFSPDGHSLATAGEDRLCKLWDLGGLADARP